MNKNILNDLDRLIKKASEKKAEAVSAALDNSDDGTKPATTGEQAAQNKEKAGEIAPSAVDGGAVVNAVGTSVTANTDGSTAASVTGSEGAQGADLAVKDTQGHGDTDKSGEGAKIAAARALAVELRKTAAALLTPFDHFLVKSARSIEGPQKKLAEEMADDDLADQATDTLMQQLESGEISDEDAEQILNDALQEGAITEDDLAQAHELASQAGGAPDASSTDPAAEEAAPVATPDAPEEMVDDPAVEAKMAAANVGPDHPEYIKKLAHFYTPDIEAGYKLAMKLAEEMAAEEASESPAHEAAETPAEESAEHAGAIPAPKTEEEAQALAAVQQELGLTDEQMMEIMQAEVPQPETKMAAAKAAYSSAIMSKVAILKSLNK